MLKNTLISYIALLALAGCASSGKGPKLTAAATESQKASLLGRVQQLDGEWTMPGEGGKPEVIVFKSVSGGSAVREIMFPGTPHEMTNMYHMDGQSLVMTHYCAAGNQPRMRCTGPDGNALAFKFDSITNMSSADEGYMGQMTLVFKDPNHIVQKWQHFKDGKVTSGPDFELTRAQ